MATRTDWVSPAQAITGRDHLAVQAISEHLYSLLLPGITNVTDRARCFTFYPWFVWAYDRRTKKKTADDLIRTFRRAECLHTLIGIVHELDEQEPWPHGLGLVGREKLVPAGRRLLEGATIRLSEHANPDAPEETRYFKNDLGGLGQYYLGPLKELEVLDGDTHSGLRYTEEWGGRLAELHDQRVEGKRFFEVLRQDRIGVSDLRDLASFCPCQLRKNKQERDALLDLLFCRGDGRFKQDRGQERRLTLLLLLEYLKQVRNQKEHSPGPFGFLSCVYSRALPDGRPWVPTAQLDTTADGWAIYHRHELLSVAVQGLFWAGLTALADEEAGRIPSAAAYSEWFAKRFQNAGGKRFSGRPFAALVEERRRSQPPLANWQDTGHELQMAGRVLERQKNGETDEVVALSVQLLTALLARGTLASPYGDLGLADRFFETYDINLKSLQVHSETSWSQLTVREWLAWLAGTWTLRTHFRVALRKLRYQSQDTFRIVPLDDGLRVRQAPPAQWSSARLSEALRFLYDLGALDLNDGGGEPRYALTGFGEKLLESDLARP